MPLQYGDYSAYVFCEGKELEPYDVKAEDVNHITCWVASEEGKEFSVHWGDESSQTFMTVNVYMDGRLMSCRAHEQDREGVCKGTSIVVGEFQAFLFSPLVLTEDDSLATSENNEALGTIRVTMTRTKGYTRNPGAPVKQKSIGAIGPVHEKSKKAGVHAVSLGDVQKKPIPNYTLTSIEPESKPFITFTFRYRPVELLWAMGVAPRPFTSRKPSQSTGKRRAAPSDESAGDAGGSESKRRRHDSQPVKPEPGEDAEDDDDDVDDITFLKEQMAMMQQRLERAEAAKRAKRVVKREISPIRVPSSSSHEVIDLT
ncbi:hypothetical protein BV20DRAFT_939909 [Pilatotrama ljubarskyi]|nr:hypothetical protein BV20DRAFT_939909 [Pilatotrama ljubarskyi]